MNFSSPNNLLHQTSKYKPLALKMKTPANVTDLYGRTNSISLASVSQAQEVKCPEGCSELASKHRFYHCLSPWGLVQPALQQKHSYAMGSQGKMGAWLWELAGMKPAPKDRGSLSWSRHFVTGLTSGDFWPFLWLLPTRCHEHPASSCGAHLLVSKHCQSSC